MISEDSTCTAAREASFAAAAAAAAAAENGGVQPRCQLFMQWSETKNDFVPFRTPERPPQPNKHPPQNALI